jgi:cytosine/adenosine deaminase-related metal-dependent hydrolase
MMMQMRAATYMAKAVSRDLFAAPANEVFDAATVVTADFLERKDLGRLAPNAVADIVIVDIGPGSMRYRPVRDPIRALVECGIGEDVETVIVDGVTRVENRRVLGVDLQELQAQTQEDAEGQWAGVAAWDPLGRSADERSPYTYPLRKPS